MAVTIKSTKESSKISLGCKKKHKQKARKKLTNRYIKIGSPQIVPINDVDKE